MELTPKEIVYELDRYIIGQDDAKRAVAVALRNRYRRSHLDENLKDEVTPKNILMIGPTGVGKTEIARRLSKLVKAPFIKVEVTKFTEVGYVGRDVESIIRDLVEESIRMTKNGKMESVEAKAQIATEERLLDILLPGRKKKTSNVIDLQQDDETNNDEISLVKFEESNVDSTREKLRKRLQSGKLEDTLIEIEFNDGKYPGFGMIPDLGSEEIMIQIQDTFGNMFPKKTRQKKVTIREARKIFEQEEAQKLINMDDVIDEAITAVEQNGIVFLDEIDKIAGKEMGNSPDVSREGVQRDLLPMIEGTTVMTKYGSVKTDYILFIAAGAFHVSKISDLIPELQGRFPIRVDLHSLTKENFKDILTQPENAIIKQQKALMEVENVTLDFQDEAIDMIAGIAFDLNESTENIGARRLHTVIEKLLSEVSFYADELSGQTIVIDKVFVLKYLDDYIKKNDLHKYIL